MVKCCIVQSPNISFTIRRIFPLPISPKDPSGSLAMWVISVLRMFPAIMKEAWADPLPMPPRHDRSDCPPRRQRGERIGYSVTAAAVSAVAVTAFAGLMRLPQRPDRQHHNSRQNGDHDDISYNSGHDLSLLSVTLRRRLRSSGGNAPRPDSPCAATNKGYRSVRRGQRQSTG